MKEKLKIQESENRNLQNIFRLTANKLSDLDASISNSKHEKIRHFYYTFRALGFLSIEILKDGKDLAIFGKELLTNSQRRKEVIYFLKNLTVNDFKSLIQNAPKKLKDEYDRIIRLPEEQFMTEGPILMYKLAITALSVKSLAKIGGIKNPNKKYISGGKMLAVNSTQNSALAIDEKSKTPNKIPK